MHTLKRSLLTILLGAVAWAASAQSDSIRIPDLHDKYSQYVRDLEQGRTDINYTDFRNCFLESTQYAKKGTEYNDFKKKLFETKRQHDYPAMLRYSKAMLSLDYTSLYAHHFLKEAYEALGDTTARNRYGAIEGGLLRSILESGDGKTCSTGWHVTQIEEEYFVLNILGLRFQGQATSSGGGNNCDRMDVKTKDGEARTFYFEANKVFEMERKLFGG